MEMRRAQESASRITDQKALLNVDPSRILIDEIEVYTHGIAPTVAHRAFTNLTGAIRAACGLLERPHL
jgi:hypothetical protein